MYHVCITAILKQLQLKEWLIQFQCTSKVLCCICNYMYF